MDETLALPVMIGAPPGVNGHWWWIAWEAWQRSQEGNIVDALKLYREADGFLSNGYCLNADLSVLRHNSGDGTGTVRPVPPTEDWIVSCFLPRLSNPENDLAGFFAVSVPSEDVMAYPYRKSVAKGRLERGDDRQHVMVLSTGRCGTVSLFQLFQGSNLEPYHTYWFMQPPYSRWQFQCRLVACRHDDLSAAREWVSTRKAECLGEKPMIGLNHIDTVYAPIFAAIHENSRFVYLRRDPEKVFKSFVGKDQWGNGSNHFRPVRCSFKDGFKFSLPAIGATEGTRYHLNYTEAFSRTFGRVMGDRWIEISADRLFGQDREEIAKLLEFVGSDIDLDAAVEHFATKINEKKHRVRGRNV